MFICFLLFVTFSFDKMPRVYERKLIKNDENIVQRALEEIKQGEKINTIAKKYEIPRGTLRCRLQKASQTGTENRKQVNNNFHLYKMFNNIRFKYEKHNNFLII